MSRLLSYGAALAVTAAGILGAMLVVALNAGVTQQKFEHLFAVGEYTAAFNAARAPMFATLAFDNVFILAYSGAIAFGMAGLRTAETAWPAGAAALGIVAAGLLDYAENLHFVTMYAGLDAGVPLSADAIAWRMWASLMKWHIVYASMFAAGFVIPVRGIVSFALAWSLWVVLPVVGVLVYVGPETWRTLLTVARYALMVVGFLMFAYVFVAEGSARRAASAQA